jgi:hypothetical protein
LVVATGPGGVDVRNGADVLLQSAFVWLAGAWGPRIFMFCLIGVGAWLIAKDIRAHPGKLSPAVLVGMFVEAALLSIVFGLVVSGLTVALLGAPPPPAAIGLTQVRLGRETMLMLSIGAGLYEELLFRVLLVGLMAWAARKVLGWRPLFADIAATVLGALIFSAFHYIGPFGDRLDVFSFVFRTIAGLFFSALYLTRGFGITAWTHALYDVLLLLR